MSGIARRGLYLDRRTVIMSVRTLAATLFPLGAGKYYTCRDRFLFAPTLMRERVGTVPVNFCRFWNVPLGYETYCWEILKSAYQLHIVNRQLDFEEKSEHA